MATASDAILQYEAGQQPAAIEELTDSGNATLFDSSASIFSGARGKDVNVLQDGVSTGGEITPDAGNNAVDVAAFTANVGGLKLTVGATDALAVARPVTNDYMISSIVYDGSTVSVVQGSESAVGFSTTRDAAGGPPLIPVGSIELGQVRYSSTASGVVQTDEIEQVDGLSKETSLQSFEVRYETGQIEFLFALPLIHTGNTPKKVYASFYTPVFATIQRATDFTAPENSFSVTSTEIYSGAIGSVTKTLNAGGFTAYLENGIDDNLVKQAGDRLWFKFFPDSNASQHNLSQGTLGMTRNWPAGGEAINANFTINAESEGINRTA